MEFINFLGDEHSSNLLENTKVVGIADLEGIINENHAELKDSLCCKDMFSRRSVIFRVIPFAPTRGPSGNSTDTRIYICCFNYWDLQQVLVRRLSHDDISRAFITCLWWISQFLWQTERVGRIQYVRRCADYTFRDKFNPLCAFWRGLSHWWYRRKASQGLYNPS